MPIEIAPSLADVLTLTGAAVSAALVTTFVELTKHTPQLRAFITRHQLEQALAIVASLALVLIASIDRHQATGATTLNDAFVSVVAWLAIAKLATGIHDEFARKPGAFTESAL